MERSTSLSIDRTIARSIDRTIARSLDRTIARSLELTAVERSNARWAIDRTRYQYIEQSINQSIDWRRTNCSQHYPLEDCQWELLSQATPGWVKVRHDQSMDQKMLPCWHPKRSYRQPKKIDDYPNNCLIRQAPLEKSMFGGHDVSQNAWVPVRFLAGTSTFQNLAFG